MQQNYQNEWTTLQNSYDRYEVNGLWIKLIAIILFFLSFALATPIIITLLMLLVFWLQEAIWKTFQNRTEQRLLNIEQELTQANENSSFQFYSQWESTRPSTLGLIKEYAKQACRPTIAFPYIALVAVIFVQNIP